MFRRGKMRPGTLPNFVSDFRLFQKATVSRLEEVASSAFSGLSQDGKFCWVVKGASLEVIEVQSNYRRAAWEFGQVLGDRQTCVTCVKELPGVGRTCKLLVGVFFDSSQAGLVCVFDVGRSMVVKAIEMPYEVTDLEVVSTCYGDSVPRWALSEHLRYFCGVVAAGTSSGHVFLIDLCLDETDLYSTEDSPCKAQIITPRTRDIEYQRASGLRHGKHLAMQLNEECFTKNGFVYQKPDGITMKTFRLEVVSVTCLKYIPQVGILVIGYSFGCYQLWKLHVPTLEYSSRLESDPLPVTHIAYQEPENDPKNFCYIWIGRGLPFSQLDDAFETTSSISLYQLAFNRRTFYSNYGVFYEELTSVCLRLDHELGPGPCPPGSSSTEGSRLLNCYTLCDPNYQAPARLSDESFDSSHGPDLSLCVFVWAASDSSQSTKSGKHLAIFDINRWYHAQMPASIRYSGGAMDTCPYFAFCRLDGVADKAAPDNILACHVDASTLRKFVSDIPMPPEQHFYPASLAFDVLLVMETGIVQAQFLGSQEQVLANMKSKGPMIIVQPHDLYSVCIFMGLLPRPTDLASQNPTSSQQREAVLTLALEYNLLAFINRCATMWATGEYERQGCTLKFLLDWAWDRVTTTKYQIDTTCTNLYNWSGVQLDKRGLQTLYQAKRRLSNLISLFKAMSNQTTPITEQGFHDLQGKILTASLLSQHLSVVLWFLDAHLLPEYDEDEELIGDQYSYPAGTLIQAYKTRRAELQNISSEAGGGDLLMVDGLMETMGVKEVWERCGGNGLYPPPSLQALLSVYLLKNVDVMSKHSLVLYLLLDLVSVDLSSEDSQFSEKVTQFTRQFNLPSKLVKQIQGFWLVDHGDFEQALSLLLHPVVTSDYTCRWQHQRILKALLYQGDSKMALRYLVSREVHPTTPEEVKMKITVLLANGKTCEALECQRRCHDPASKQDLLTHLFVGCRQTKTLDDLLQFPLEGEEEKRLVDYMMSEPYLQEQLVMYYLQRSRIAEAIQLNEKLRNSSYLEKDVAARERAVARNAVVDSYLAMLPEVQRKFLFEQIHVPKKNTALRREVRRPTPLSTTITKGKGAVMSQSSYIIEILKKVDEVQPRHEEEEQAESSKAAYQPVGPFLCRPVTPLQTSLRSTPTVANTEFRQTLKGRESSDVFSLQKSLNDSSNTPDTTRRQSRYFSASCLTLLKTPIAEKQTPRRNRLSSANVLTPQSILKVRNLISSASPSPRSLNTTPNSAELDASAKKNIPRKLGYGLSSQPGTPRSVSFAEPSNPSVSRLRGPTSQPGTPRSVSFAETSPSTRDSDTEDMDKSSPPMTPKSVSFAEPSSAAGKLRPFTTPTQTKQRKTASISLKPTSSRISPTVASPPSPRSVRDRSPTPESSNRSPKFASAVDTLTRRPLRTTPPESDRWASPGEISDEEVEDMDTSYDTATSPLCIDSSITSTSTVQSPSSHSPVKHSPQISPTVKVSSPKTTRVAMTTEDTIPVSHDQELIEEEVDEMEVVEIDVSSSVCAERGVSGPEKQEDEGEADSRVSSSGEEISQVKSEAVMEKVEAGQPEREEEEAEEEQKPVEILATTSPVKSEPDDAQGDTDYGTPPVLLRQLIPPELEDSPAPEMVTKVAPRKKLVPLPFRIQPVVKEERISPQLSPKTEKEEHDETGEDSAQKPSEANMTASSPKVELEESQARSPARSTRSQSREVTPKQEELEPSETPTRSTRARKGAKQEVQERVVLTPTRRTRAQSKEVAVVTPTRASTRARTPKVDDTYVTTPTRSTRTRAKKGEEATPGPSTPTRSTRGRHLQEDTETAATPLTPTRRGREAKEPVLTESKESTAGDSKIPKESKDSESPTRGEDTKGELVSGSPVPLTPTRSTRQRKERTSITPTRTSSRLKSKTGDNGDNDLLVEVSIRLLPTPTSKQARRRNTLASVLVDNETTDNVETPLTPTRRGRGRATNSPARDKSPQTRGRTKSPSPSKSEGQMPEKIRTPTRGRRKKVDETAETITALSRLSSPTPGSSGTQRSPGSGSATGSPERAQTPTRGRRKKTADMVETDQPVTPTRRSTRKTRAETEASPSRSVASKAKSEAEDDGFGASSVIPADFNDSAVSPARRRSIGRKASIRTSRTSRTSDTSEVVDDTDSNISHSAKSVELESVTAKSAKQSTPSRRKKAKKDDDDDDSPSRHTRSHEDNDAHKQPSSDVYDIQRASSFQFSNPMEVDFEEDPPVIKPFTPVKSFLFSPPITRGRHPKSEEVSEQEGVPMPSVPSAASETDVAQGKKKTKPKTRRLYTDELLLISPGDWGSDPEAQEEGRNIVSGTQGATRTTRRKTDRQVPFMLSQMKKPKTRRRFGPVGKRK